MENFMSDLAAELKDALAKDDVERIGHWRDIGLTQIARFPGSLSEEALDFLMAMLSGFVQAYT